MLFALMEVEGSLPKVSNILKSITKRKGEAASLIKAGLHELEILKNNLEHLGLKVWIKSAIFSVHNIFQCPMFRYSHSLDWL